MDVAGEEAQNRQADVDEKVGTAAGDDVNGYGRHWIIELVSDCDCGFENEAIR